MIIVGELIQVFNTKQITEKFRKREFVIKTNELYPQELILQLTQDKTDLIEGVKLGETVEVSVNVNGASYVNKEGEKRWFINLTAWNISVQYKAQENVPVAKQQPQQTAVNNNPDDDDLPFNGGL